MDQAAELRNLVLRTMRERMAASGPPPQLLAVAAGRDGVGVTTLAVNLAVALAEQGARVVVVNADLGRRDVTALCGLADPDGAGVARLARRDIHELLRRGPAGIQVVPALWAPGEAMDGSPLGQQRLLKQLKHLGPHAEVVVLDLGSGTGPWLRCLSGAADEMLLVTTPDAASVMDTYLLIKAALSTGLSGGAQLVVNHCDDETLACDVHRRLDQSLRRFLAVTIRLLGQVPQDEQVVRAAAAGCPFTQASPDGPATRAVQQLAMQLASRGHEPRVRAG